MWGGHLVRPGNSRDRRDAHPTKSAGRPSHKTIKIIENLRETLLWGLRSQSEKQWRDVLGVLKVQASSLDYDYLAAIANQLGIADALNRGMTEAGVGLGN